MKIQRSSIYALMFGMASTFTAMAAVSPEEAKQLGTTLTLFGAEVAGNKEGTIPAYVPKIIKAPAGWDRKTQGYPDPWGDKPLFTITAQNASQYADKLDGMIDVFKRYPNYRMDVYATQRTMVYPKYVLDNTAKNATSCKGTQNELNLEGCYGGVPFPIPKTGNQAMWNHLVPYSAPAINSDHLQTWVTPTNGKGILQSTLQIPQEYPMFAPDKAGTVFPSDAIYLKIRTDWTAPARVVGQKLVLLYSLDTVKGVRIFQYIPGQRRVKLAPDLAYDTPSPASGGAATMDEQKGFLGALDRYDFKLVGKKEKFISYNNFKISDPRVCANEKIVNNPNFPESNCIRWELHRVWKVEATLKPGFRHIYPKRVFYWDEDNFGIGTTENYDAAGKLYRVGHSIAVPFYDTGSAVTDSWVVMDMQTGIWTLQGGMATVDGSWYSAKPKDPVFYSPEALAGEGIR